MDKGCNKFLLLSNPTFGNIHLLVSLNSSISLTLTLGTSFFATLNIVLQS